MLLLQMGWGKYFLRSSVLVAALFTLALHSPSSHSDEEKLPAEKPRIVALPPEDARSVKTDAGHMVAYEQVIPGSTIAMAMQPIPGGKTHIGSPASEADRNEAEGPTFQVEVSPFWIGKYEVTWAEYQEFMDLCDVFDQFNDLGIRQVTEQNAVDAITAPSQLYDPSFTYQSGEDPQLPAVSMSQYSAKQFTKWLSLLTGQFYRLPTEAEWEHACRAGATTAYSFGDDPAQLGEHAWYTDNSDWEAHPVGQKRPNAWGLYDMHGNVAEWVLDQYDAHWYATLGASGVSAEKAIHWPTQLFPRVLRGGSWDDEPLSCRSAARGQSDDDEWRSYDPNSPKSPWWFASDESQDVGFRIVRPLVPPPREMWSKYWDADVEVIKRVTKFRIDKEGRGERGIVDPALPKAIENLQKGAKSP